MGQVMVMPAVWASGAVGRVHVGGSMGFDRASAGVRVIWTQGQVETAFEVQAGFAGDPFILRGLVESAVHF